MSQMKEQEETTAINLNEMDISNMPDREFKVMIIKALTGLEKKVEDISETKHTDKKEIIMIKNKINDIRNTLDGDA